MMAHSAGLGTITMGTVPLAGSGSRGHWQWLVTVCHRHDVSRSPLHGVEAFSGLAFGKP
jgi:hypothetical protein